MSRSAERPAASEPLATAASDLERLHQLLHRASQECADVSQVQVALTHCWRDHGDVVTAAAAALGAHVRGQILNELYKWRSQLEQLQNCRTHNAPPTDVPRR